MTPAKKTILVADDEKDWCERARELLGSAYEVEVVRECEPVVERVQQGGIDLVVLDHLMPGEEPFGTGFDVCVFLRQQYPDLPVILYTCAWEGVEADRDWLESHSGAVVVYKDVRDASRDDLVARVRELLG